MVAWDVAGDAIPHLWRRTVGRWLVDEVDLERSDAEPPLDVKRSLANLPCCLGADTAAARDWMGQSLLRFGSLFTAVQPAGGIVAPLGIRTLLCSS